jgi:hypothetical protein
MAGNVILHNYTSRGEKVQQQQENQEQQNDQISQFSCHHVAKRQVQALLQN